MKVPKLVFVILILLALYGLSGVWMVAMSYYRPFAAAKASDANSWMENVVPYTTLPAASYNSHLQEALKQRAQFLVDSLHVLYDFAENAPLGFQQYEIRQYCQFFGADSVSVLVVVDLRLQCDCPEELHNFWLLRLRINPLSMSADVCVNEIKPWSIYVPRYRITSS